MADPVEHSIANTKQTVEDLRELVEADAEGELDMYATVTVLRPSDDKSPVEFKFDNGDLNYKVTFTPLDD